MRIAYRRMSGPIGFTQHETGQRGLWLEKRVALVNALRQRGHEVDYVNRMTKFSALASPVEFGPKTHDLLFVEFGSSNEVFYKKDLEETRRLVHVHRGRCVFINDDPDLPYLWKTVAAPRRWTVWMNARSPQPFGAQPADVVSYDAPFACLLPYAAQPRANYRPALAYVGRPNGRKKAIQIVLDSKVAVEIAGRASEWNDWPVTVVDAPTQAARAEYYAGVMGCLALGDAKHKKLGWRTGRAYHALHAGTPAIAEHDHPGLREFARFETVQELRELARVWCEYPEERVSVWEEQRAGEQRDLEIFEQTFRAHGL